MTTESIRLVVQHAVDTRVLPIRRWRVIARYPSGTEQLVSRHLTKKAAHRTMQYLVDESYRLQDGGS